MDIEETPLRRGHRCASEANLFETSRSWRKAMYKHQEAANCFTECLGLTGHPQANKAILLLISKHSKRFEEIRDQLTYSKSIKDILFENGYNINANNPKINDEIYNDLRTQMQRIISYSHKNITTNNMNNKSQINEHLKQCDVRKSVNMKNDKSMIFKRKIILNDNFFNPDHETQSKKELIENNRQLHQQNKMLELQLKNQTELINKYQNDISNKVKTLRQTLDHLYNINNNENKNNNNEKKDNNNNNNSRKEEQINDKNVKEIINKKVNNEKIKYENDKEKLRNIHAKQLQELKKKIKDWMEYARKQEQHAKIYKKQLQLQQHNKNKNKKNNLINNKSGQLYSRGIPESQEINEND